jgi:Kef-type K+ transport system membrane component KefB
MTTPRKKPWPSLIATFKKRWAFIIWILIFAVVLSVGMFGAKLLPSFLKVEPGHFWHHWELAALGSTCLFNALFYLIGFFMAPRMFLHLNKQVYVGLIPILMLFIVGLLVAATIISLHDGSCMLQLALLLTVTALLCTFDYIMAKQSQDEKVRQDFMASVVLNDIPACIAFLALLAFSSVYHSSATMGYDPPFRAFIGGAIAFQMLLSNWVLALIFRKPGEWYQKELAAGVAGVTRPEEILARIKNGSSI